MVVVVVVVVMAYSSALKILTPLGSRTVFVVVPQMVADPT